MLRRSHRKNITELNYRAAQSDRGCQYALPAALEKYGMTRSMSRNGNCWGINPTERVLRKLNSDWPGRFSFKTKDYAKTAVRDYISCYNVNRIHSTPGYSDAGCVRQ